MSSFQPFGPSHLVVLVLSVLIGVVCIVLARRDAGGRIKSAVGYGLGGTLFLNYVAYNLYRVSIGAWELRYDLPLEFCDWAGIAVIIALFTRRPLFFEIGYYWIFAGSLHGLITPDLQYEFPHPYFLTFFISHAGLVIAAAYMLLGLCMEPRPGSALRVFLIGQIYLVVALVVNATLETNYGYLARKPFSGSLMDYFGPWPYYILVFEALAFALFHLFYLPFWWRGRG